MAQMPPEDASLREWQAFHAQLDQAKSFDRDPLHNVAFLCGEIGELVRAIQDQRRNDATAPAEQLQARVGEELADVLAYVLKLANYSGVDLQGAYARKMRLNLDRTWRGSASIA